MKKYTLAVMMMRSTRKDFDQISALQAACDTSIAVVTGGVYPREGYWCITPNYYRVAYLSRRGERGNRVESLIFGRAQVFM